MGGRFQPFFGSSAMPLRVAAGHLGGLGRGPLVFGGEIIEHVNAQAKEQSHVSITHHRTGQPDPGEPHDVLGADFQADDRAHDGYEAQLHVHIAHLAVLGGGHDGFAEDVGQVGADGVGHGEAEDIEGRGDYPGPTHAEEAAQHPHGKADGYQDEDIEMQLGNGQIYS